MPRGGKRKGAGRPARQDGRKLRVVKVPLTDEEFQMVKDLLRPDERRKPLMDAIEKKERLDATND